MKQSLQPKESQPLSSGRQSRLMSMVVVPMAACYPAITAGAGFRDTVVVGGNAHQPEHDGKTFNSWSEHCRQMFLLTPQDNTGGCCG